MIGPTSFVSTSRLCSVPPSGSKIAPHVKKARDVVPSDHNSYSMKADGCQRVETTSLSWICPCFCRSLRCCRGLKDARITAYSCLLSNSFAMFKIARERMGQAGCSEFHTCKDLCSRREAHECIGESSSLLLPFPHHVLKTTRCNIAKLHSRSVRDAQKGSV